MINKKIIRLSYYDSKDGPRLVIFGPMEIELFRLRKCFSELSGGEKTFDLDSLEFVHSAGVTLRLQSLGDQTKIVDGAPLGLQRILSTNQSFVWRLRNKGWKYLGELIDGLIESKVAGHQYLTHFPDDDAIVVVSKGEYADNVLNV